MVKFRTYNSDFALNFILLTFVYNLILIAKPFLFNSNLFKLNLEFIFLNAFKLPKKLFLSTLIHVYRNYSDKTFCFIANQLEKNIKPRNCRKETDRIGRPTSKSASKLNAIPTTCSTNNGLQLVMNMSCKKCRRRRRKK